MSDQPAYGTETSNRKDFSCKMQALAGHAGSTMIAVCGQVLGFSRKNTFLGGKTA